MGRKSRFLILLFLTIIISPLTHTAFSQQNGTVNVSSTLNLPIKSEISQEDIVKESQKNLDGSIGILNIVATLMGVLVALVTLVVVIGGLLGFFEYRRWKTIRQQAEKYSEETKKSAEEVRPIVERLKKAKEEVEDMRKISLPPLDEIPVEELKKKLEEYGKKIEFLEAFGVPLKAEDYFVRGNNFYYKGNFEFALKAYDKAIELKPDYALAWSNKGVALGNLGRYDEALKAYDKAIELKLDDAGVWSNKGVALGNLGRYDEVLKAYDKAIELKPNFAEAWINKSYELYRLGRYDEALKAYDKAIELKPDDADAWYNKTCVYSLKGDKENLLKNLYKAIELDAKYKEEAKKDEDFRNFWDDKDFKKIVD
jgi:tetratricopeptide (TPR) repeat protein